MGEHEDNYDDLDLEHDPELVDYIRRTEEDDRDRQRYRAIPWEAVTPEKFGKLTELLLDDPKLGGLIREVGVEGDVTDEDDDAFVEFLELKVEELGWGPFEEFEYYVIPALARRVSDGWFDSPYTDEAANFIGRNTLAKPVFYTAENPLHIKEVIGVTHHIWGNPALRQLFLKENDSILDEVDREYWMPVILALSKYWRKHGIRQREGIRHIRTIFLRALANKHIASLQERDVWDYLTNSPARIVISVTTEGDSNV